MVRRIIGRAVPMVRGSLGGILLFAFVVLLLAAGATGYTRIKRGEPLFSTPAQAQTADCADTAMALLSDHSAGVAQAAYDCFDTNMATQLGVSRDQFVLQVGTAPVRTAVRRIGSDGHMVFYSNGNDTGYIVHLDADGKVGGIE